MEKLLQGSIHNYLRFIPNSISAVISQIEIDFEKLHPNVSVYISRVLTELQKEVHHCRKYEDAKTLIQNYIRNSKEFIFNKEEYIQFNKAIEKLLPAIKYAIEDWEKNKKDKNQKKEVPPQKIKKSNEIQSVYDKFKAYLKVYISPEAYKSDKGGFIRAFSTEEEVKIHKIWFNKFSNHEDSEEIKQAEKNLRSQLNTALSALWEENQT
jgi:hypothetical protein